MHTCTCEYGGGGHMGRGEKRTPPRTLSFWQKCAWVASFIFLATLPQRKDLSVLIGKMTFRMCKISEYLPGIESGQQSPI